MSDPDLYSRINAVREVASSAEDTSVRRAAIRELADDLDELADDEAARFIVLNNLATDSLQLYAITGELADLENGIEWGEDYLDAGADGTNRFKMVSNLGIAYGWLFERTADDIDREWMIEFCREALSSGGLDADRHAAMLSNLRTGYADRFFREGTAGDLDTAIDYGEQAVAAASQGPGRHNEFYLLGYLYHERFDITHARADADAAIRYGEQSMALSGPEDAGWASVLALVADSHRQRFDRDGDRADLAITIERLEQAVAATAVDDPQRARRLSNLGVDYHSLFLLTERPEALQKSIDRIQEALERTPAGHPDSERHRGHLAMAYRERYRLTGEVSDLDTSITLSEQVLSAGLTGQARGAVLSGLANGYFDRHTRTGSLDNLDKGIELNEQALPQFEPDGADYSACLSNLAIGHRRRYERAGVMADLEAAVSLGEQALRSLPDDHPQRANRQLNLALSYAERRRRHGTAADLDTAIDLTEQSLAGVFLMAHDRELALLNLSNYYRERFEDSGDARDLELSVERAERLVEATPVGHPGRPLFESAVAGGYLERYRNGGTDADLDAVIEHVEQARIYVPRGEPRPIGVLSNAALAYQMQAERRPVPEEVVSALVEDAKIAQSDTPREKVSACQNIGMLALKTGHLHHAALMFRAATEALPLCAPRSLDLSDQEVQLAGSHGLVTDTVAVHLALGEAAEAVELAELGRGIVLSNQLETRSDVTALRGAAPGLAREFELLRAELDAPRPVAADHAEESAWLIRRREAAAQWDQLLDRIRQLPELADFLAPPRIADLRRAASQGAVVLVNTSNVGSDAVLLRSDSVTRVSLDGLTLADAQSYASAVTGTRLAGSSVVVSEGRGATPELLTWLWRTITEPVLTALGHLRPLRSGGAGEPLPRVWWVPTGILSLLPLHAAGMPGGPSALDYVISSYAPTIRALLHGRKRPAASVHTQLTVAMRNTPGLPDLPGCEAEARNIQARYQGTTALADADATIEAVLDALPRATFAHFSCHGSSHPVWPSQCALHLHDGALPVSEISKRRLRTGELAYLSACSTAQASMLQADEALHLASAFQLAGYRHVVASLWPLQDDIAAQAARQFYGLLGDPPAADRAPAALHQVVQTLRAAHPDRPQVWASLVHNGP